MSVEQISLVLNHSTAKGTDKLVLIGIANHDGDGGAWPSIDTLARYANVDERTVRRSIARLVDLGELDVVQNAGGTPATRQDRRPNLYRITLQHGRTPTSSRDDDGRTPVTGREDAHVRDGRTPTSPEPSYNHPENLPIHAPVGAGRAAAAFADEFLAVHGDKPPRHSIARIGRDARIMLVDEQRDPALVEAAAKEAARSGHANLAAAFTRVLAGPGMTRRERALREGAEYAQELADAGAQALALWGRG